MPAEHARLITRASPGKAVQIHLNASANAPRDGRALPNAASVVRNCRASDLPPARRPPGYVDGRTPLTARDLAMQRMMGGWWAGSRRVAVTATAATALAPAHAAGWRRPHSPDAPSRYVGAPRAATSSARPRRRRPPAPRARTTSSARRAADPARGAGAGAGGDAAAGEPLPEAQGAAGARQRDESGVRVDARQAGWVPQPAGDGGAAATARAAAGAELSAMSVSIL